MPRTAVADRRDFHAWWAYRAVVDAEASAEQAAVFEFVPEGRGRVGVWIYGGLAGGVRIGAVHTTRCEVDDPKTGIITKKSSYSAVADAVVGNGDREPGPADRHRFELAHRRCGTAVRSLDRAPRTSSGLGSG